MNSLSYLLLAVLFLTNIFNAMIPYLTRKTENFGVSIPEYLHEREDFKRMRKQYSLPILLLNFISVGILALFMKDLSDKANNILFISLLFAFIILSFLFYLKFHFQMKRIKKREKWTDSVNEVSVIDLKFREQPIVYSNLWFLIPLLIIFGTTIYTFILYEQIPEEIPIHTSISGVVTYEEKSVGRLLMMPIIQVFTLGIMMAVNYIIKHSKQAVNVQNPERSRMQNILFRRRSSLFIIVLAILITILFSFIQVTFIYPLLLKYENIVIATIIAIIIIYTVVLGITTGQGGSRIRIPGDNEKTRIETDDDKYWK